MIHHHRLILVLLMDTKMLSSVRVYGEGAGWLFRQTDLVRRFVADTLVSCFDDMISLSRRISLLPLNSYLTEKNVMAKK